MESKSEGDIWELEGWVQQVDKTRQQLGNRGGGGDSWGGFKRYLGGRDDWLWGRPDLGEVRGKAHEMTSVSGCVIIVITR